jgi:dTDP-4-amino-4,6-dideoxygalactose transaminase
VINTSFSPWPSFSEEEAEAVKKVILSNKVNYWTGEQGRLFEQEFADYFDSRYAIALANGTVALDLALKALGVGEGDEVIVTPRSFIASVSSVVNAGAIPVFADIDINTQCLSIETIAPVLSDRTKALIVVHLAGMPAEMDSIMALAEAEGIYVIEDCAQAHGAKYKGRSVGSIGHIGAWSFCQDKIMTTGGEGGMVTTNNEKLWRFMQSYKDHGKNYDVMSSPNNGSGFRWVHDSFGTNWRMTELQAVLGRKQLKNMPQWAKARRKNAAQLNATLEKFECMRVLNTPVYSEHAYYKHYAFVNDNFLKTGWSRDRIIEKVTKLGVPCFQGGCAEIYLEKAFDNTTWRPSQRLVNAKLLGETSLMFLIHPTLTPANIEKTCSAIEHVLKEASG